MNKRQKKNFDKKLRFKKYKSYKNYIEACKRMTMSHRNGRFYDPLMILNHIKPLSFPPPPLSIPFDNCPVDQFIMGSSARKRLILSGGFKGEIKDVKHIDESSIYPIKPIEYALKFAPRFCGDKLMSIDLVKGN